MFGHGRTTQARSSAVSAAPVSPLATTATGSIASTTRGISASPSRRTGVLTVVASASADAAVTPGISRRALSNDCQWDDSGAAVM
ncbi:hypothetical protein GCM10027436_22240 [Actinophytocola sediminis]